MPQPQNAYDDAEDYLDTQDLYIKRQYDGRGYEKLTKTEQAECLLDLFFDNLHKNDLASQRMRDGMKYASTPEVAYIDSKGKAHIHPSIKGEDRARLGRHERTYIRARKEGYSRTASLSLARADEYRGMTKQEIRQYNGRIGARQKYLKYSTVKLERKGAMPHGRVYAKHLVERRKDGTFKRWVKS